jgi:hypothetical protein
MSGDRVVPDAVTRVRAARRVLVIGIGGGGDVVGALAVGEAARALGTEAVVGGLTWERRPIDPVPGPRRIDELIEPVEILHPAVAIAGPHTAGPGGFLFAESRMAAFLGGDTVLLDPNPGPAVIADGLATAADLLGCDLVVLLDVGGDVLAHGDEPGLASPLADAIVLAAAPALRARGVEVLGAVFGAGCDGELLPGEVAARLEEVADAGGDLGDLPLTTEILDDLERSIETVVTEASAMAVRCARGETGETTIRNGRRTVMLTPEGGRIRCFDPLLAIGSAARLAAAVADASDLEDAHQRLTALGIRTELAYERDAAAASD